MVEKRLGLGTGGQKLAETLNSKVYPEAVGMAPALAEEAGKFPGLLEQCTGLEHCIHRLRRLVVVGN